MSSIMLRYCTDPACTKCFPEHHCRRNGCGHSVEDHVPDDFDPAKPCAVEGCRCEGYVGEWFLTFEGVPQCGSS